MKNKKMFVNICRVIVLVIAALFILSGDWYSAAASAGAFALSFVPEVFEKITKIKIPYWIEIIYVIFLIFAMTIGTTFQGFKKIPHFDSFLHVYSGAMACLVGYILVKALNKDGKLTKIVIATYSFCFAEAIAVAWEIFEYTGDSLIPSSDMQKVAVSGINDTMVDLIVSLVGAAIIAVIIYRYEKKLKE